MKNILLLSALVLLVGVYTYYDGQKASLGQHPTLPAQDATALTPSPLFDFSGIDAGQYSLEDFKGKIVFINFWASWCAPCVIEFPQMIELANIKKKETVFLFISIDQDKEDIARFLKKHAKKDLSDNVYIAHDEGRRIADVFQTYKIPETYILDKNLYIREKIIGADYDWTGPQLLRKISDLFED